MAPEDPRRPFNPLSKPNLAESIARKILDNEVQPLPPNEFEGTGLYLIYYVGDYELYRPLAEKNQDMQFRAPIYLGKAVASGSRNSLVDFDEQHGGHELYSRLRLHARSIERVNNLALEDFRCRYIVVDEVFIPLSESILIQHYSPLWNTRITGFGNNDPGSNRTPFRSKWDTLHRGRVDHWTAEVHPGMSVEDVEQEVRDFFSSERFQSL